MAEDKDYHRLQKQLYRQSPFADWHMTQVTFKSANTDVTIPHTFNSQNVVFMPVSKSKECIIFRNPSTPWTNDYIQLRSSAAEATVTLLLGVPAR